MRYTVILLMMASPAFSWVADAQVKVLPRENTRLTPTEFAELFHLEQADGCVVRRHDDVAQQPYTGEERAHLWHLNDAAHSAPDGFIHQPYTAQDFEQLWHLAQANKNFVQRQNKVLPFMSSQDYNDLWKLNKKHAAHVPFSDHEPYTAIDRAQLWGVRSKSSEGTKDTQRAHSVGRLLSDEDRALLWKLYDDTNMDHPENPRGPYTDKEREELWALEDGGKMLHDEMKREVYSDKDRATLWHLDEFGMEQPSETTSSYTNDDRADLWKLHEFSSTPQNGKIAEYTAKDRKELWHL